MAEVTEESKRVSVQLTSLSTQLIESVDRQSQLEEKLNHARRTIASQLVAVERYDELKTSYEQQDKALSEKDNTIERLQDQLQEEQKLRLAAEADVSKLNKEVEDLTASLFDEANNMVAEARREKQEVSDRNAKLLEQLREKDLLLETLNLQLKNLKLVLQNLQPDSSITTSNRGSMVGTDRATDSSSSLHRLNTGTSTSSQESLLSIIYSPRIPSIRYDLPLYKEFLKFLAVLPHCDSIRQTAPDSKLLRRLVNDEIQPVLRLDNASGLGWILKRTLMSMMMEGSVVIEPISGINEMYRIGTGHSTLQSESATNDKDNHLFNFPANSPPIAMHEPCAFCSENRDDSIEHARMYLLKTQVKSDDGSLQTTNQLPLCQNCLIKVRQTCEIFAFLRSLKSGAWHLEKVTLASIVKNGSKNFSQVSKISKNHTNKAKRKSFMAGLGITQSLDIAPHVETSVRLVNQSGMPTTNIQRAWVHLCKLRSILHWAHIGIWTTDDSVATKIGPHFADKDEDTTDENDDDSESYNIPPEHSRNDIMTKETNSESNDSFTSTKAIDNSMDVFDFESGTNEDDSIDKENSSRSTKDQSQHSDTQNAFSEASSTQNDEADTTYTIGDVTSRKIDLTKSGGVEAENKSSTDDSNASLGEIQTASEGSPDNDMKNINEEQKATIDGIPFETKEAPIDEVKEEKTAVNDEGALVIKQSVVMDSLADLTKQIENELDIEDKE